MRLAGATECYARRDAVAQGSKVVVGSGDGTSSGGTGSRLLWARRHRKVRARLHRRVKALLGKRQVDQAA